MKFIITLPIALQPYCYPMGKSKNGNWWIWGDKSTNLLRIYSPSHNPWGKEWLLQPTEVKQKSDNSEYSGRLDFRLYPPEQAWL